MRLTRFLTIGPTALFLGTLASSAGPGVGVGFVWAKAPPSSNGQRPVRVTARLLELPLSKRCANGAQDYVVARYKVLQSSEHKGDKAQHLYVAHACPELPRGYSSRAKGNVLRIRPGQTHRMELVPFRGDATVDPFPRDRPRYRANKTNHALAPPKLVVRMTNNTGRSERLTFHSHAITIGYRFDDDVTVSGKSRLRIEARSGVAWVVPIGGSVSVGGVAIGKKGTAITYRSAIRTPDFSCQVSLLHAQRTVNASR